MYIQSENVTYWYIPQVRKKGLFQRHICTTSYYGTDPPPSPPPLVHVITVFVEKLLSNISYVFHMPCSQSCSRSQVGQNIPVASCTWVGCLLDEVYQLKVGVSDSFSSLTGAGCTCIFNAFTGYKYKIVVCSLCTERFREFQTMPKRSKTYRLVIS